MLLILATLLQPAAPALFTCPSGEVIRMGEHCLVMPDHRPYSRTLFFDSGSDEIRREWEPMIEDAVRLSSPRSLLRIEGHSDTPGSAATNRRMSLKRAQAVADALKAKGARYRSLTVVGLGEDDLLVPTAEGVREIQNRRVRIVIFP